MSCNSSTLFNILLLFFVFFSSSFMILICQAYYLQLLANPHSAVSLFVECDFLLFFLFYGSDLANGTLAVLFFLANGAGAMNRYCRELLSPQTGIAALTLTVMKGFEAKKGRLPHFLPVSVYSAYPSI